MTSKADAELEACRIRFTFTEFLQSSSKIFPYIDKVGEVQVLKKKIVAIFVEIWCFVEFETYKECHVFIAVSKKNIHQIVLG